MYWECYSVLVYLIGCIRSFDTLCAKGFVVLSWVRFLNSNHYNDIKDLTLFKGDDSMVMRYLLEVLNTTFYRKTINEYIAPYQTWMPIWVSSQNIQNKNIHFYRFAFTRSCFIIHTVFYLFYLIMQKVFSCNYV